MKAKNAEHLNLRSPQQVFENSVKKENTGFIAQEVKVPTPPPAGRKTSRIPSSSFGHLLYNKHLSKHKILDFLLTCEFLYTDTEFLQHVCSVHGRRLFTGSFCGRIFYKNKSTILIMLYLHNQAVPQDLYIPSVHLLICSRCVVCCNSEVNDRSAAASFLLCHFLYLPLSPLKDLHPLGDVARSLLSLELLHILEEPVPASTNKQW